MEKINLYNFRRGICCLCIVTLIFQSVPALAFDNCSCYFCGEEVEEEEIDYESLEEYEEIFRNFEEIADAEDEEDVVAKTFFLKKWCKKLKRWFKKKLIKILKKMVGFKKFKSGEHCAYEVAHFKRKIDKKLHKTGDIENMLEEFDQHSGISPEAYEGMNRFKSRIRYYYYNNKAKPTKHPDHDRYDQNVEFMTKGKDGKKNDLDDVPVRALIGGVEIACGVLIHILPFPGCLYLGRALIGHGAAQIFEGYMKQYEDNTPEEIPEMA